MTSRNASCPRMLLAAGQVNRAAGAQAQKGSKSTALLPFRILIIRWASTAGLQSFCLRRSPQWACSVSTFGVLLDGPSVFLPLAPSTTGLQCFCPWRLP